MGRGLRNGFEVLCREDRPLEILAALLFVEFPSGQRNCSLECVLDLPAVPPSRWPALVQLPVLFDEAADLVLFDVNVNATGLEARYVLLPDLLGGCPVQPGIVETDVDSGSECLVELANPVGCEDDDARVVFKYT